MRLLEFDAPSYCWSGLTSGGSPRLQKGMKLYSVAVGDTKFIPSSSGYDHITDVVESICRLHHDEIYNTTVLAGHSNGNIATSEVAYRVGKRCPQHRFVVICFDRTLGYCRPLDTNVIEAMDLWSELSRINVTDDFIAAGGIINRYDFPELSHTGITLSVEARRLAVELARKYIQPALFQRN